VGHAQGPTPPPVVEAGAHWRSVDLLSDVHLQPGDSGTLNAWRHYLANTRADAVFILGDLFEVWVGDDAIDTPGFASECAKVLRAASVQRPFFFLHGNRDFLVGDALARACGVTLLADPSVLAFGTGRWLLTHGDALCLADTDYLAFRDRVRAPAWTDAFLARPLPEREALARQMRQASQLHQAANQAAMAAAADVDAAMASQWLDAAGVATMIHGHTHRPAEHDLGQGRQRIVLSDWDANATPPRLQVLRLTSTGRYERIDLSA
jgi:UDP-2,3-diacylglucosamine hydrolase